MASSKTRADWLGVYAEPVAADIVRTLDLGGYRWKQVASIGDLTAGSSEGGWGGVLIDCCTNTDAAWAFARTLRREHDPSVPILVLAGGGQLDELDLRDEMFDDFCISPFHPAEFEARVRHLMWRTGGGSTPETIEYEALLLNVETYQATIAQRPLDLTYMEYELLKFLAQNPGKVFTREMLLSRVWGYEYYGGARTVDVHIRRLRAKLGEEHAGLIHTVRSVGYRFGQSRWAS
jgi:DNA-binding response OmpR family regulator